MTLREIDQRPSRSSGVVPYYLNAEHQLMVYLILTMAALTGR